MTDDPRSIEVEIEVAGTPEEVWRAIATGPGISSWYVPHTVEERDGGVLSASFGPGMDVTGRVASWDPPRRVVFDSAEDTGGMAFEWTIEARDGGTCVVRLVNSGFGHGEEWDARYDGMAEGWLLFLENLRLHLAHFAGQNGTATLPMAMWDMSREKAWTTLLAALGLSAAPAVGQRITTEGSGAPALAGTVTRVCATGASLLLEQPFPGTGFIAAEGYGEQAGVSVWCYLYGAEAAAVAAREEELWAAWLTEAG
ncbi:MAG: SRPBCC domain-containing protein [Acidimicrobiales bacterium]